MTCKFFLVLFLISVRAEDDEDDYEVELEDPGEEVVLEGRVGRLEENIVISLGEIEVGVSCICSHTVLDSDTISMSFGVLHFWAFH